MHPVQMKMARAALGLSIEQFAAKAGLSPNDILHLEAGEAAQGSAYEKARTIFDIAGIEWIGVDGVRYKAPAEGDSTIPLEGLNSSNDE
jgi:transcriptional regulator with XRE-family HTH domain